MLAACGGGGQQPAPPANTSTAPVAKPAPGDHELSLEWNGKQRTFTVHAPPNYDGTTPLPLVVTMHHYPGTADAIATTSGMSAKADSEGFLVLYPEGHDGGMNAFLCCGSEDDVGFGLAVELPGTFAAIAPGQRRSHRPEGHRHHVQTDQPGLGDHVHRR